MVANVHGTRRQREQAWNHLCLLNGADVSKDTFYADVRRGVIRVYERDAHGRAFRGTDGHAAWKERRGRVELVRKPA